MKEDFKNDSSILDILPLIINEWKRIVLYSIIGAILFLISSFYFFSDKYYTDVIIVGEFSEPVETKYGTYVFSSNNLIDYTHNLLDIRILESTIDEYSAIEHINAIKLDFETEERKDHVSGFLSASTDLKDIPLEDFLTSYFNNFLNFLNTTFYRDFLKEVLVDNSILIDKLNTDILKTSKELEAYSATSASVKELYNSLTGFNKEAFFSTETLKGIDILKTYSALMDKELELSLLKVDLENTHNISENVKKELDEITKNDLDISTEFISLFNQRIRLVSTPSTVELKSTSKLIIIFVGAFIGFILALLSLFARQLRT